MIYVPDTYDIIVQVNTSSYITVAILLDQK